MTWLVELNGDVWGLLAAVTITVGAVTQLVYVKRLNRTVRRQRAIIARYEGSRQALGRAAQRSKAGES